MKPAPYQLKSWKVTAVLKTGERLHLLNTAAFTKQGAIHAGHMNVKARNLIHSVLHIIAEPKT